MEKIKSIVGIIFIVLLLIGVIGLFVPIKWLSSDMVFYYFLSVFIVFGIWKVAKHL